MAGEQDVRDGMEALKGALDTFDQADSKSTSDQQTAVSANQQAALSAAARDQARAQMKSAAQDLDATINGFFGGNNPPEPPPAPPASGQAHTAKPNVAPGARK